MAYSESYTCDVCGDKKGEGGDTGGWRGWSAADQVDAVAGTPCSSAGVKHLCGARCAGTLMDRWMSEQHEDPDSHYVTK